MPKAVPERPRTLEGQRVSNYLNHSPRQHSKCVYGSTRSSAGIYYGQPAHSSKMPLRGDDCPELWSVFRKHHGSKKVGTVYLDLGRIYRPVGAFSKSGPDDRSRFQRVLGYEICYAAWENGWGSAPPAQVLGFGSAVGMGILQRIPPRHFGGRTSGMVRSGPTQPDTHGL